MSQPFQGIYFEADGRAAFYQIETCPRSDRYQITVFIREEETAKKIKRFIVVPQTASACMLDADTFPGVWWYFLSRIDLFKEVIKISCDEVKKIRIAETSI